MFHSSSNTSEIENDNNEARVMASAAAKVSEDLSIKDAEILRFIEERRSTPKEEKHRLKDVKDNKTSKELLKTSKEYEISRESNQQRRVYSSLR